MKKQVVILGGLLLLTGCANDDVSKEEAQPTTTHEEVEKTENEPMEQESTNDNTSSLNSDLQNYEEFDIVEEYIDVEAYQGVVQTNNQGKRVILFEDSDGHEMYKSILIKHDNRLKIISFDNEGLLYNNVIQ